MANARVILIWLLFYYPSLKGKTIFYIQAFDIFVCFIHIISLPLFLTLLFELHEDCFNRTINDIILK